MTRWPAYIELGLTIVGAVACTAGASL